MYIQSGTDDVGIWTWIARLYYSTALAGHAYEAFQALGAAGFLSALVIWLRRKKPWAAIRIIVGVLSLAVVIFCAAIALYLRHRDNKLFDNSANPQMEPISRKVTYRIVNDKDYQFIDDITAKARVSGVSSWHLRYWFSGSGVPHLLASEPPMHVTSTTLEGQGKSVNFDFARPLTRGETQQFSYVLDFPDGLRQANPYFEAVVNVPIKEFTMCTEFPLKFKSNVFTKRIYPSAYSPISVFEEAQTRKPGENVVCWTVSHPLAGSRLRLEW